jgi:DNA-binding LacI/PurR family transcriptional regulator
MRGRLAGYQRAMREAGREPEPVQWIDPLFVGSKESDIFEPKTRFSAGYLAPLLTASEPVDGILAISDGEALPLAAACRLFGKVPNRDVFIGGYDNYVGDLPELEIDPSALAATVDKLNWKVGEALASLLLDRMAGTLPPEPQKRVVRPRLVVRQHTSEES